MNCPACGQRQSDPEAAFCGHCGAALAPAPSVAPAESLDTLGGALCHLANLAASEPGLPPRTALMLRALAGDESRPGKPAVAVLGEYRRGKTTVINRLLGRELLATGPREVPGPVRVRFGRGDLPAPDAVECCCEAAVLEHVDLVDTASLTMSEGEGVSPTVRHALAASAVVFCIDARQALSAWEREILTEELLPLASCPILLAVTYLDHVPDPADREEIRRRLASFAERAGPGRLEVMLLAPGRRAGEPLYALEQWITEKSKLPPPPEANREHRLRSLLNVLEAWAESTPAGHERNSAAEHRDRLLARLNREHNLAVLEATALFREKLSRLRAGLKAVLRGLPEESHGREGLAHVVRSLRAIVGECGEKYLATLQASLLADGAAGFRATAEAIDPRAALDVATPGAPKLVTSPSARRDWRAGGVAAVALAVALAAASWVPLVGAAITFVAVNNWRVDRRRRDEAESSRDAEAALQAWLVEVEPQLIDELRASADRVLLQIREQIENQFDAAGPAEEGRNLRAAVERCRRLLDSPVETPPQLSDNQNPSDK